LEKGKERRKKGEEGGWEEKHTEVVLLLRNVHKLFSIKVHLSSFSLLLHAVVSVDCPLLSPIVLKPLSCLSPRYR